jgi:hypothetical protein
MPVMPGCEINDDPHDPICRACRAQLAELELAWAIAFPKTTSLRSSPVIIGSTTLSMAAVATAASIALPPAASTSRPTWVATSSSLVTMNVLPMPARV